MGQSNQTLISENSKANLMRGNPRGAGRNPARRYINKLHAALDKAVDKLGDTMEMDGASAMAVLIADAMHKDVIGTLHKLSPFFPKNITLDVSVTKSSEELTDDELEAIISQRRNAKADQQAINANGIVETEMIDSIITQDSESETVDSE